MSAVLIAGVPRSGTTWIGRTLGRTEDASYVNEPDGFRDPYAFTTMLTRGENPVLEPGDPAPDLERLWAGALAGGRPAGTPRDRLARMLYERTPLDERRAARARGRATGRLLVVARTATPRVAAPDVRHVVVKSVQCALALEWIADRFSPRVLVVERNPLNVLASWSELDYVRSPRELASMTVLARARWGIAPPPAGAPHLAVQAFTFGVQTCALLDAATRHPEWVRRRHEDLCVDSATRFRALAAELGLDWDDRAERFLLESDREGTPYRTLRRTEDQPDRWRERLDATQVATIRETLAPFPHTLGTGAEMTDDGARTPARPIRVLWLVKGLGPGGAENLMVAAAAVRDRDAFRFEVEYLLPWKDALVGDLEALGVPTHCLDVRDERDVRWAWRLRARLRRDPVDILHAQSPYPAGIARLVVRSLPRRVRPRLVYTVHNTFQSFSAPTRVLNGLTYPLDDVDLAVSVEVHETIWRHLRARTEIVVQGVQLAAVRAELAHRDAVRVELGIEADEVVVGTIANFRAQKDYPNLLAAARALLDRGWPGRIVAVGQGPLEAEMRALHARLGLGDRVLLLGRRDDAVRVLAACDMFTMASDNEGLPVALMEALALGLPVAATAVGGIPEAVTDGVEGLLVPPRSPEALADAIATITSDRELRAAMAANAVRAGERFDIRVGASRIEEIYRELVPR